MCADCSSKGTTTDRPGRHGRRPKPAGTGETNHCRACGWILDPSLYASGFHITCSPDWHRPESTPWGGFPPVAETETQGELF